MVRRLAGSIANGLRRGVAMSSAPAMICMVALITATGCEQTLDEPEAAETTPVSDMGGGGGDSTSTYGKARDTAVDVVDDLKKRDQELSDLIDETTDTP